MSVNSGDGPDSGGGTAFDCKGKASGIFRDSGYAHRTNNPPLNSQPATTKLKTTGRIALMMSSPLAILMAPKSSSGVTALKPK